MKTRLSGEKTTEQNTQREDIDEAMGEGGGDEEEDGECEDGYEDGHGSGGVAERPGTQRRKMCSFYFRTGAAIITKVTTWNVCLFW